MRVSQPMNGNLFELITLLHISHTVIWYINRTEVISRIRKNELMPRSQLINISGSATQAGILASPSKVHVIS